MVQFQVNLLYMPPDSKWFVLGLWGSYVLSGDS